MLGRAFFDSPLIRHVLPDERRRLASLGWFMGRITGHAVRHGEAYKSDDSMAGVALWFPPSHLHITLPQLIQAHAFFLPLHFGLSGCLRYLRYLDYTERLHKRDFSGPHWYLCMLGVEPERQRQGIGSRLLEPMLKRLDDEALPCYLETDKEENLDFYRRFAFNVRHAGSAPGGGPSFWTMVRGPQR
jgi:ribosomal protein S18 acetylase RimI-like enzyme